MTVTNVTYTVSPSLKLSTHIVNPTTSSQVYSIVSVMDYSFSFQWQQKRQATKGTLYHLLSFAQYAVTFARTVKVTTIRPNIKQRSHHDVAYLQTAITSYILQFRRYYGDKMFKLKFISARFNQSNIMTLHTYKPQPMPLHFVFLHSMWTVFKL